MGPLKVTMSGVDAEGKQVEPDRMQDAKDLYYAVKIERCRFLEEAGCASVCANCCKMPTQEFFEKDMGLSLYMEPDYKTYGCTFMFNRTPIPKEQDPTFNTACFEICGTKKAGTEPAFADGPKCDGVQNAC